MVLDTIGYWNTAPGAGGAAAAAAAGDSLTIRNARQGTKVLLLDALSCNQAAGFQQVICPNGNDTTRDKRWVVPATQPRAYWGANVAERLQPQDMIAATIAGSAVAGDIEQGALVVWYEDLPGISAHLIDSAELKSRFVRLVTVAQTIAAGAGGGWTGAAAINATTDLLRANRDYAVLGIVTRILCSAVGLRSPDWGNLRVCVPGNPTDQEHTQGWFWRMSDRFNLPLIPVFNSANRGNTFLDCMQDENAVAVIMSVILAELSS